MTTPPYQPPAPAPQQMNPADEKMWATLVHVGGIFFQFIPALIGYLVLKDRGLFVRAQTATALNFQITIALTYPVGGVLRILGTGFLPLSATLTGNLVFSIIAAFKANQGQWYTYPVAITFVS